MWFENQKFIFAINPKGGDITHLELKEFKKDNNPNSDYFTLLGEVNPQFYAQSGILSKRGGFDNNQERINYELVEASETQIHLRAEVGEIVLNKIYDIDVENYSFLLKWDISNKGSDEFRFDVFYQFNRDNSPDPVGEQFGLYSYLGGAILDDEGQYTKISLEEIQASDYEQTSMSKGYLAFVQKYFTLAFLPLVEDEKPPSWNLYAKSSNNKNIIGIISETPASLKSQETYTNSMYFYAGPKESEYLELYNEQLTRTLDYGIFWFISGFLIWLLKFYHSFGITNWGLSIICLTITVRLAFFWLTKKSYMSMAKMRALSPKLKDLKELHGEDKQAFSKAMMDLYKKEKVNPLSGCLPMLVQIPVFIALYWGLVETVELRHQPFFLWVTDLSAPDPYFILPVIMGVTMYIQQKLNPAVMDPMQKKIMDMIPIFFTFFFLWFPTGLIIYWITSNIWTIFQQLIIIKQLENK